MNKQNTTYKNDFNREHYDRISVMLPKGMKIVVQEHASKYGEKTNAFINRAIIETMGRDRENDSQN